MRGLGNGYEQSVVNKVIKVQILILFIISSNHILMSSRLGWEDGGRAPYRPMPDKQLVHIRRLFRDSTLEQADETANEKIYAMS